MKKLFLVLFLLGNILFLWSENIDVIMMVDTSWSLWQPFDEIVNYLIDSMIDQVLDKGDNFHLLQFSTDVKVEITEEIANGATKETIKNKVRQLRAPLQIGKYTDLLKAIDFLYNFTNSLPEKNDKLIILITDGIHDPPPGSSSPTDLEQLKEEFINKARMIKKKGWNIHILEIPPVSSETGDVANAELEKKRKYLDDMAKELGITIKKYAQGEDKDLLSSTTEFPEIVFPGNLGEKGSLFDIPFNVKNAAAKEMRIKLIRIEAGGVNILNVPSMELVIPAQGSNSLNAPVKLPGNMEPGPQSLALTLVFSDDMRMISGKGNLSFTYVPDKGIDFNQILFSYLLPALGLVILALVVIILFIHFRRKGSYEKKFRSVVGDTGPVRTTTAAVPEKFKAKEGAGEPYAGDITSALEMIVESQKRHIGLRNIHRLHKNRPLSVGGGHSMFLIFLVPVSAHIAEIHYDGRTFIFTPRKKEFFPQLTGPVKDCLDTVIPIVSAKGYRFSLWFHRYVSPLEEINNLMRSIRENALNGKK